MDSLNSTILPLYSLHTYISYKTGVVRTVSVRYGGSTALAHKQNPNQTGKKLCTNVLKLFNLYNSWQLHSVCSWSCSINTTFKENRKYSIKML